MLRVLTAINIVCDFVYRSVKAHAEAVGFVLGNSAKCFSRVRLSVCDETSLFSVLFWFFYRSHLFIFYGVDYSRPNDTIFFGGFFSLF